MKFISIEIGIAYDAERFGSFRRLDTDVKASIRFTPRPVEVSCFASLIIRVLHKEVPPLYLHVSLRSRFKFH